MSEPKYKHDCTNCVFIGREEELDGDVYFCDSGRIWDQNLLCRRSSKPSDYYSMDIEHLRDNFIKGESMAGTGARIYPIFLNWRARNL